MQQKHVQYGDYAPALPVHQKSRIFSVCDSLASGYSRESNLMHDYRHSWYPPGLQLLHGRNYVRHLATESTHALGEKTIADVCEALIGASLLTQGKGSRFDMAIRAVTIFVNHENHKATSWADYRLSYSKPAYQIKAADGAEIDLANKIFNQLGYRFRYPRLLGSAFTHPSYPSAWAKVPCYQRLEFLGDALLDMVCIEYLFDRFPDKDPQWLTEHKVREEAVLKCGFSTNKNLRWQWFPTSFLEPWP